MFHTRNSIVLMLADENDSFQDSFYLRYCRIFEVDDKVDDKVNNCLNIKKKSCIETCINVTDPISTIFSDTCTNMGG